MWKQEDFVMDWVMAFGKMVGEKKQFRVKPEFFHKWVDIEVIF